MFRNVYTLIDQILMVNPNDTIMTPPLNTLDRQQSPLIPGSIKRSYWN